LTFSSLFTGAHVVYSSVTDTSGSISNYLQNGTWIVP